MSNNIAIASSPTFSDGPNHWASSCRPFRGTQIRLFLRNAQTASMLAFLAFRLLGFFAFFFFGFTFLTAFLAFLTADFAALTTRLVTDCFFAFLAMVLHSAFEFL